MTPRNFISGFIGTHEGKLSLKAADNGNWYDPARYLAGKKQARGLGQLVGSMYGVTAYALVRYRVRKGMALAKALKVTPADIATLDLATAIDIGVELYFLEPGFDRLPWNRVTASIMDKGWGSGPDRAVRMLQQLVGVAIDGKLGPKTAAAYARYIALHGEERAAREWCAARIAFDTILASNDGPNDPDRLFINGWNNRSRSFLPGTAWWKTFERNAA